ncbi:MAG: cation:proton antiporter [Phycisphaeraceae bacterium]|nr:cation:proton antiporter [Phycisphaeraceae bacterium]
MWTLAAETFTPQEITIFLLSLLVLLGASRILGEVMRRWGQPAVLGEILAGVILGSTFLGGMFPQYMQVLFPADGAAALALEGYALLAVVLLLLVAGLEVDLSVVWRQGKAAILISMTGIIFPLTIGTALAAAIPTWMGKEPQADLLPFALFVGVAMSITALPVIARVLIDLNLLKSDIGMLIMSAAMVNDLLGWMGFAVVLAMMQLGVEQNGNVGMTLLMTLAFVVVMLSAGRWAIHHTLPSIQAHSAWPGGVLSFVIVVVLLAAALTETIGVHAIFGAFIAGVAIGDSSHLRQRTRDVIHQFVTNIFAPVFFATIGLRINFIDSFNPVTVLLVLAVALVVKIGGCYLGAKWAGLSKRESWAIGAGMSARGAMEIVLGQLALRAGLIGEELFVAIVIMALVTSMISGPMMQKILQSRQRRSLKDLLSERSVIINPKSENLEDLIYEMSRRAAELTNLNINAIALAVVDRERIMHTGLPGGLAVPHARLAALTKPCIVLALSKQGIDFDSPDGQPARIVCLLLTALDDPDSQIEMLSLFAQTFERPATRQAALAANKPTELLAVLNLAQAGEGGTENV